MKRIVGMSVKGILFLVLTVGMIYKLGATVRPLDSDHAIKAIDTFHDMPENTMEVIGYGTSHIWNSLNVVELYQKYGIGVYNYGCPWQHINTTELFIEDSLRTQSPKLALIETYNAGNVLQDADIDGEIYYTRAVPEFRGKQKYLKQCFGNDITRYLSYYMPLYAFHKNWANLKYESFVENAYDGDYYATMGYRLSTITAPVTISDPSAFEQAELSGAAVSVLDRIVDICRENGIEIIFFTVPYQGEYAYGDAMKAYAREKGYAYFNLFEYMDVIGIDCETDFCDAVHLNESGAVKVSDFLGEYIIDHYDVTDWRAVEGNIWERNFQ